VNLDYDMAPPAPKPISRTVAEFLRRSISISDLLKRVLRGWPFVVIGTILGFLVGVYNVWITPPSFTASISMLPADGTGVGEISSNSATLGLLAGLAGFNTGKTPKFPRFLAALKTEGVARILDERYDMLCLTDSRCDPKTRQWRRRTGFDAWWDEKLAQLAHQPDPNGPGTMAQLAARINGSVVAAADRETNMLVMSYSDRDPKIAAQTLLRVVQATDDFVKEQDRKVNQQYVDYVSQKLTTNINIPEREALSNLLIQQEHALMMTGVDVPYAATALDVPKVMPNNPMRRMIILYTILGFLCGLGVAILFTVISPRRIWSRTWNRY